MAADFRRDLAVIGRERVAVIGRLGAPRKQNMSGWVLLDEIGIGHKYKNRFEQHQERSTRIGCTCPRNDDGI